MGERIQSRGFQGGKKQPPTRPTPLMLSPKLLEGERESFFSRYRCPSETLPEQQQPRGNIIGAKEGGFDRIKTHTEGIEK